MHNYLFTIIVPCYNISQNVEKLVKMLVNERYLNYEVIFVDDCSKDDTYSLLDLYCKAYKNFKVFKPVVNGGPGVARNLGIERATGEYIIFCDADDVFDIDCLEKLESFIKEHNNLDMLVAPYILERGNSELVVDEYIITKNEVNTLHVIDILRGNCAPWSKIFKKEIIQVNNIMFPSRRTGEDICFVVEYAKFISTVYKFSNTFYKYIMNENSLTHSNEINMNEETTFEVLIDNYRRFFPEIEIEKFVNDHLLTMAKRMYANEISNEQMEKWFSKENERYPGWIYEIGFSKQSIYRKLIYLAMYFNSPILIKILMGIRKRFY